MLQWACVAKETYPEAAKQACLLIRQLMCQRTSVNAFSVDGPAGRAVQIAIDSRRRTHG